MYFIDISIGIQLYISPIKLIISGFHVELRCSFDLKAEDSLC